MEAYPTNPKVSEETVRKVAKIARIKITDDEAKEYSKDLESILDAFQDLQQMESSIKNVKPTFQPIESSNVMRDDEIEESLSQIDALSNAKLKEKGYFKGPKAI